MKASFVLSLFLSACVCLFLVENVSARSFSYSQSGDIIVQTLNNGSVDCDSMICPAGSSCRVTKKNDPENVYIIVRQRTCFNANGDVIQEEKVTQENPSGGITSSSVSTGGGRQMTPEEERQLQEQIKHTQEQIQAQLHQSLGQFMDGTFESNLKKQIDDSLHGVYNY